MNIKKLEVIKEILYLSKELKIKSFHADDKVYDFRTNKEPEFFINKKVWVANKYIHLLCETFTLDFILEHLEMQKKDINVISNDLKFISLDCTIHAMRRFLKRFIYIYLDEQNNFEFSSKLKSLLNDNFDYVLHLYMNNSLSNIKKDYYIIEIIKEILILSKTFNPDKNTGRLKDQWNFKLRNQEHSNTQMYFTHPFLFIVEDGHIKTIELYSPSLSLSEANKMTSIEKMFRNFLNKKMGYINDKTKR
jgi:hypothetical protein